MMPCDVEVQCGDVVVVQCEDVMCGCLVIFMWCGMTFRLSER